MKYGQIKITSLVRCYSVVVWTPPKFLVEALMLWTLAVTWAFLCLLLCYKGIVEVWRQSYLTAEVERREKRTLLKVARQIANRWIPLLIFITTDKFLLSICLFHSFSFASFFYNSSKAHTHILSSALHLFFCHCFHFTFLVFHSCIFLV